MKRRKKGGTVGLTVAATLLTCGSCNWESGKKGEKGETMGVPEESITLRANIERKEKKLIEEERGGEGLGYFHLGRERKKKKGGGGGGKNEQRKKRERERKEIVTWCLPLYGLGGNYTSREEGEKKGKKKERKGIWKGKRKGKGEITRRTGGGSAGNAKPLGTKKGKKKREKREFAGKRKRKNRRKVLWASPSLSSNRRLRVVPSILAVEEKEKRGGGEEKKNPSEEKRRGGEGRGRKKTALALRQFLILTFPTLIFPIPKKGKRKKKGRTRRKKKRENTNLMQPQYF